MSNIHNLNFFELKETYLTFYAICINYAYLYYTPNIRLKHALNYRNLLSSNYHPYASIYLVLCVILYMILFIWPQTNLGSGNM